MALTGLPPNAQQSGEISIVTFLHGTSTGMAFGYEGMSREEAIGRLIAVSDRLREERRLDWDTCPECGLPWSEHFEDDDAEEDDDESEDNDDGISD